MPKIEMNMPELPEGWEYDPDKQASSVSGSSLVDTANNRVSLNVPVRRVGTWRRAKIEDIDKGLKVRFRNPGFSDWTEGVLKGFYVSDYMNTKFWFDGKAGFQECEVLDKTP